MIQVPERNRLTQSYYCIKKRLPLSSILQLGNWEFKIYAFLLEKADYSETPDGEWIWKPFNLRELLGISRSTSAAAISKLKSFGLIETFNGTIISGSQGGRITVLGSSSGRVKVETQAKRIDGEEKRVRDRLQKSIGGIAEAETPVGRIDLLTDTEVIEVKRVEDWKGALGQVLAYQTFYPNHKARPHLFGCCTEKTVIEQVCSGFGVKVTGEEVEE